MNIKSPPSFPNGEKIDKICENNLENLSPILCSIKILLFNQIHKLE